MLKKILNKKVAAVCVGCALLIGAADLTVAEKSHLKPILESVHKSVSETVDDLLGSPEEEAPKVLIPSE